MVLNPFRVKVEVPGEYHIGSVRQSVDGLSHGLLGYFPFYSEAMFGVRRAATPTGPYGFVGLEPVFRERGAAPSTPR